MTYNKHTHFLMFEEGDEYDTTYKAGAQAPCSGIYYCDLRRQPYIDWCAGSPFTAASPAHAGARRDPWRLAVKSHY